MSRLFQFSSDNRQPTLTVSRYNQTPAAECFHWEACCHQHAERSPSHQSYPLYRPHEESRLRCRQHFQYSVCLAVASKISRLPRIFCRRQNWTSLRGSLRAIRAATVVTPALVDRHEPNNRHFAVFYQNTTGTCFNLFSYPFSRLGRCPWA